MKKPKYVPKRIPRGMYLQTEDLGKMFPKNLKSITEDQKTSISSSSRVTVPAIDKAQIMTLEIRDLKTNLNITIS